MERKTVKLQNEQGHGGVTNVPQTRSGFRIEF